MERAAIVLIALALQACTLDFGSRDPDVVDLEIVGTFIRGTVRDAGGTPVEGALLDFDADPDGACPAADPGYPVWTEYSTRTDLDGTYLAYVTNTEVEEGCVWVVVEANLEGEVVDTAFSVGPVRFRSTSEVPVTFVLDVIFDG